MYLSDYHVHTSISPDCKSQIVDICKHAIENGLNELCFTDHIEYGKVSEFWQNPDRPYNMKSVRGDIERAKKFCGKKLVLKCGVEIGQWMQAEEKAAKTTRENGYDFVLASIHSPINHPDVSMLDYSKDVNPVMEDYYIEMMKMVKTADFDTLGHFTLPIRYAKRQGYDLDLSKYHEQFREIFKVLVSRGKGVEINTSGFRTELGKAIPDRDVLSIYKECGGEIVTLGSDSHRPQDVGGGIREGQALLREVGFTHFCTFTKRKPIMKKLI